MRRRTGVVLAGAAVITLTAAIVGLTIKPSSPESDPTAGDEPVTRTAELMTLTSGLVLAGTLSYGDPLPLQGAGGGLVTALPTAGDVVAVGQRIYESNGVPVVLFRGERPFWRTLELGMSDGPDVQQLEQNLADLGFTAGLDLDIDRKFTANTAAAVRAWQASLGVPKTGSVALGAVAAADSPTIRVDSLEKVLGEPDGGTVLEYTQTILRAYADLTADQEREVATGTPVTLTLKDGSEASGTIASIEPSVPAADDRSEDTPAQAVVDLESQDPVAAIGPSTVRLKLGEESVDDALVVPVTALVASGDERYSIDVLRDGTAVRIPVEIGLVADARVQIVSSGGDGLDPLEPGEQVVVG